MAYIDRKRYTTLEGIDKLASSQTDSTVTCKCGHSIVMPKVDRTICNWCGSWCYRTKEIEFKYKMKEAIIKKNKEETC